MRSLKKLLEKIFRKSALAIVKRGGPGLPMDSLNAGAGSPVAAADSAAGEAPAAGSPADGEPAPVDGSANTAAGSESGHAPDEERAALNSEDSELESASSTATAADPAAQASDSVSATDSQQPEGQLPHSSPAVNPAEGSVVASPDVQPGATADAGDVGGSGTGAEAISTWSGEIITVDVGDLTDYVGQPPFTSDRIYQRTPAGAPLHFFMRPAWPLLLYLGIQQPVTFDGS